MHFFMNKNTKTNRQHLLAEIIRRQDTGMQLHLVQEFRKLGIAVTQATISRDLQEMGYIKVRVQPGIYRYERLEPTDGVAVWEQLKVLFANFVTDLRGTGNLLLVKTSPGNANGVASLIDRWHRAEILGTVAGDDTILVVVDTEKDREAVENDLHALL
jgi:transcriptional regulator of arginine metabolism